MVIKIMAINLLQDTPVLEPTIDCFLSVSDSLLHIQRSLWIGEALWTLDVHGCFSNIPIICFNSFKCFKLRHQSRPKNSNIRPLSTKKRTINPYKISSQNTHTNFITKSALTKFVAICFLPQFLDLKISTINAYETVVSFISN